MTSAFFAKSVGKILGRTALLYLRGESRVVLLIESFGFGSAAMKFARWVLRLTLALVVLTFAGKTLFFVFIAAMSVIAAGALITGDRHSEAEDTLPAYGTGRFGEWRDGDAGYGHYDSFGHRDDNYGK